MRKNQVPVLPVSSEMASASAHDLARRSYAKVLAARAKHGSGSGSRAREVPVALPWADGWRRAASR